MADSRTAAEGLTFHRLSAPSVLALARGEGGRAAVEELLTAERSRRLLLLRALADGLSEGDPPQPAGADPLSHRDAWALLGRVQRHAPQAFEDILMCPHTGMWLSLALRRMRGATAYEDAPLWVVVGHLSALAAAAGARAGLGFSLTVPVRHGRVPLPTLGCAVFADGADFVEPWGTAQVEAGEGRLRITRGRETVTAGPQWSGAAPGWHAVRRLDLDGTGGSGDLGGSGGAGSGKVLALDELDPYRTFPHPSPPRLLSADEARTWQDLITDAWEILRRDEPESAEAMRVGLMSLAPTPARERYRPHSVTAGDAFGGVMASRPDDVAQLAATLVHEFQHTKLGGLIHLGPLSTPPASRDGREQLFYAPWRDDPRPLSGLLQGIYAFAGVARFWRVHRHAADAERAPMAHFEFALWRAQVSSTVRLVQRHEQLTPLGRRLLGALRGRCVQWMAEPVPPGELALAEEVAADHRARWRAHHLRPPVAAVEEAVGAWRRGEARPPAALTARPELVPDARTRYLDTAAVLARYRLGDPAADPGEVEGAVAADLLLARGDLRGAREAFTAQLTGKEAPFSVSAWAGLGRSLAGSPEHLGASRLLRDFPERACAVQGALEHATGQGADPVELAAWLGLGES
ncbi:HEXXH motif domain-containing protein [Streptomyces sp. NPDC057302]|uniref:HEXXH motif domain-containing protein n=1 Tax=Streptomyces sp. NPDC057302 TaxID=3346094 RepID=UPI0036384879